MTLPAAPAFLRTALLAAALLMGGPAHAAADTVMLRTPDTTAAQVVVAYEAPPRAERVPVGRIGSAAARFLHYVGLVLALGPMLFAALVVRSPAGVPPLTWRGLWGLSAFGGALLLPAALLTLAAHGAAIAGDWSGAVRMDVLQPVLGGRWGGLWQIRFGVALLLGWIAVDAAIRARRATGGVGRLAAGIAVGGALVVLTAIDGHASSTPPVAVMVAADAVHLLAACAWIGGLLALMVIVLPTLRRSGSATAPAVITTLLPRFSTLALTAALVIVATGLYQSWRLVGGLGPLFGTGYGRLLLVKIGLFLLLLAPAAVNRFVLKPRLRSASHGAEREAARFTRLVIAEAALGVLILAVVGALAGTVPPRGSDGYEPAGFVFNPPLEAPAIRAALPDGRTFDLAAEQGNVVLVFFGFTNCPDFCPVTMSRWARVRELLGDDAARTRFLFVSVDAERDSPEIAYDYVRRFDESFVGMAPDSADLVRIESGFFLRSMRMEPAGDSGDPAAHPPGHDMAAHSPAAANAPPSPYDVMHSTRFFLIGPEGTVRIMYAHDAAAEDVATDIRRIFR
jgi:putative copper export protein